MNLKKFGIALILVQTFAFQPGFAQDSGSTILKIFGNYHHGLSPEVRSQTAFEILRAYLGYKHTWESGWKAQVKLDIGSPDDLSQYSLIRRYAYFKNAYISYSGEKYEFGLGLVDMLNIDQPEEYWGHRYIAKEYQDEYKFGPSADIGVYGIYHVNDKISINSFMVNGEGYKNLQRDNIYRYGWGIVVNPVDGLCLNLHYDLSKKEYLLQNMNAFLGYRYNNRATLGLQAVYQINHNYTLSQDLYGFSLFGMYSITPAWEIFGRYDIYRSNIDSETGVPWQLSKDGSGLIAGIQYIVNDFFRVSANYQDWYSYAQNGPNQSYIYLNMEVNL